MPVCPKCHSKYEEGSFSCPACEVILEDSAAFEKPETDVPTLVEALLTPDPSSPFEVAPQPSGANAVPFEVPSPLAQELEEIPDSAVLRILDLDLHGQSFTPYEARFLGFVDRRWPAKDVREAAKLSPMEFAAVVRNLVAKGVIEIQEKTDPIAALAALRPTRPPPIPTAPPEASTVSEPPPLPPAEAFATIVPAPTPPPPAPPATFATIAPAPTPPPPAPPD